MNSLTGKVALISGATGLIGSAVSARLAKMGATVVALHRSADAKAEKLSATLSKFGADHTLIQTDLVEPTAAGEAITQTRKLYGQLDIVICCAGATKRRAALMTNAASIDELMILNYRSAIVLAQTSIRAMSSEGRAIMIGSYAGRYGLPGQSAYAGTKAALEAWAKSVAGEVGHKGITVNVVSPGAVETENDEIYSQEDKTVAQDHIALGRFARVDEIAETVAFLASPAASYITGAVIPVDGGARF